MATVKKATVDSTMAKVEATKATTEVAAKDTEKKEAEKKAPAKKAPAKKAEPKAATAAKEEAKKAPAKKAPAKKATATKKVEAKFYIEFAGNQIETGSIVDKALEISGKKSVKEFNVYYQPENGMVYFTADGEEGSFAL